MLKKFGWWDLFLEKLGVQKPFIRPLTDFISALPNHLYNFTEREPSEETHVTDKSVNLEICFFLIVRFFKIQPFPTLLEQCSINQLQMFCCLEHLVMVAGSNFLLWKLSQIFGEYIPWNIFGEYVRRPPLECQRAAKYLR